MFCPKCKAEYKEGITRCAECGVDLVADLEKEEAEEGLPVGPGAAIEDLEAVFETDDSPLINEIASLLEAKRIPYLVQSGTALREPEEEDQLIWHAVLFVPEDYEEETGAIIHEVQLGKVTDEQEGAPQQQE